jgi:ATP-dependent RNA helicase DDX49/DBP8
MTQFDVDKILNIEEFIGLKLDEIKFNEDKVLTDMVDITKAIRKIKIVRLFSVNSYRNQAKKA